MYSDHLFKRMQVGSKRPRSEEDDKERRADALQGIKVFLKAFAELPIDEGNVEAGSRLQDMKAQLLSQAGRNPVLQRILSVGGVP
jgi:hypothetical protein